MKPIETRYKGYRFRSRLEARWAVFFDALGVKWEYEPEGIVVGNRGYLPDFLVQSKLLVEIKPDLDAFPEGLPGVEIRRWEKASEGSGLPLLLLHGTPSPEFNNSSLYGFSSPIVTEGVWLNDQDLGCCRRCGGLGWVHHTYGYMLWCRSGCEGERPPERTDHFIAAAEAARGARFEWGESGAPRRAIDDRPRKFRLDPSHPRYDVQLRLDEIDRLLPLASNDERVALVREKVELATIVNEIRGRRWTS